LSQNYNNNLIKIIQLICYNLLNKVRGKMDKSQKLRKMYTSITKGAIHTLLILFVLGMAANIYIEIPAEGNAWAWVFGNSIVLAAHAILGTLLLIVALASLGLAIANHNKSWIAASLAGFVFTGLAAFSGADFLSAGQTNLSSMLMALGFLGALVSYALGVFQTQGKANS
jgi:hypothetical protein